MKHSISSIPLLPVRDMVVFPYMVMPLFVGRESSIKAVEDAESSSKTVMLCAQKDPMDEHPNADTIYNVGTIANVIKTKKLPDGRLKVLVQGVSRGKINSFDTIEPFIKVFAETIEENEVQQNLELDALLRNIKLQLERIVSSGKLFSLELLMVIEEISDISKLGDLITANLGLKVKDAQLILEILDPVQRLYKVSEYLSRELEIIEIQNKINDRAKEEITKTQKEYFLKEQMKAIQNELGSRDGKDDDLAYIRQKLLTIKMPDEAREEAFKQFERLERMHPDASESAVLRTYLEWMIEMPWMLSTDDNLDIERAKKILDEDHYDLEEVKERIIDHLAVSKLSNKLRGPILCFVGAPGVGKTSLGKSIARALGRKFVRISLGGVKDEAEIRGHRRTYVGAMPGKIMQSLKIAGTNNPVFVLDEIDKLGADFKGDPSSALLEVLDPEQNFSFRDHYLNVSFDLSNVMFIATANFLENIPVALRDRMEIVYLSGYTSEEKIKIAKKHLIPKQKKENGLDNINVRFNDRSIMKIITQYTREAGLRTLERLIAKVYRKVARLVATDKKAPKSINDNMIEKFLGCPIYIADEKNIDDEIGISTGLAWTQFGGQILLIEVASSRGSGLKLTGNLGEVMKESATTALSYIKTMSQLYGISDDYFQHNEIHVHFPSGATPKDGPSAGIAIATAIISHITGRPVSRDVAMTGELSLSGKVLPIGGLKEKSLAALRAGIKTVIAPEANRKDLVELPKEYKNKLNFVFVEKMDEVVSVAMLPKKIEQIDNYRADKKIIKAVA